MEVDELKREYEKYEKKYDLPLFGELNGIFEIEKIEKESEILLKLVRKIMVEKIVNSLGFVEMLLNPMNAPMMYHAYLRSMDEQDKKIIGEIYEKFSVISVDSLEREIEYDEGKEAELIKKIFKTWSGVKEGFNRVLKNVKNPVVGERKERGYFG
ncbi:MAG: hypothetical protein ABIG28_01420 [archaeon]